MWLAVQEVPFLRTKRMLLCKVANDPLQIFDALTRSTSHADAGTAVDRAEPAPVPLIASSGDCWLCCCKVIIANRD
jgi:hypothetical protein